MSEEKKSAGAATAEKPLVRLRTKYREQVVSNLMKQFNITNRNAVPRVEKICLNIGFGKAAVDGNTKFIEQCVADMTTISGQKAVITRSKKAVSNFKLRENMQIGCRVTLRGERMYEFMDRLVSVAIPRIRDFRGLPPKSFDGRGNYSMGLAEQNVFPEIDSDKIDSQHGMDITICTNAKDDDLARALLKEMGMPFRDR